MPNIMMRNKPSALLYFILASPYAFSAQGNADVARIEKKLVDARGGKEADLRARLAKALVSQAADEYKQDHVDQAEASLQRALSECERATTVAIAAGKKEKTVEIRLREISHRLNEIARLVPFDIERWQRFLSMAPSPAGLRSIAPHLIDSMGSNRH